MIYKFLCFFILSLTIYGNEIRREQLLMGTFVKITLEEKNKKEMQQGFKIIKKIENSLSSYKKTALLYQLNQDKNITANNYLLEAIRKSQNLYKLSHGYFDITIGSITKNLYHFGEQERIPSTSELQKVITNIKGIHIDKKDITLDSNIILDLGGMGKGFAVDKVANYYREHNITHGIIALSGDIQALHPTTIYIDSPFEKKPFVKLTTLQSNISISTSGTYRRYIKTKRYHHLINPKSKKQGKSFTSITLITKRNNTLIDAMATALGVMSFEEAITWLNKHPYIGYILIRTDKVVSFGHLKNLVKFTTL